MRVDLHCHTKKTKKGESETRNVTSELFAEKIKDAEVKIVAITNHNHFDFNQYTTLASCVKDFCQVWPGVELDICGEHNNFHLIVVVNPKNHIDFSKYINKIMQDKNLDECSFEMEDIVDELKTFDALFIPHYHKEPSISDFDGQKLLKLVGNSKRIFNEPSSISSLGVFSNHNMSVIIGSDVQNWEDYEASSFAELRLPVSSFEQFCLFAEKNSQVVKILLEKKTSYRYTVSPHESVTFELDLFQEVNIIFGQKGTGKTEIVDSLRENLTAKGQKCEYYKGTEKEEEFKRFTNTSSMERDVTLLNADSCEDEFKFIAKWEDSHPTSYNAYLHWYETKDNNKNKKRMEITDTVIHSTLNEEKYEKLKSDLKNVVTIINELEKIEFAQYISEEEIKSLNALLDLLKHSIREQLREEFIELHAVKLSNFTIEKIKAIADKMTDTKSKPSTTGFSQFSKNRIKLLEATSKIIRNISKDKYITKNKIGSLEDKGDISVHSIYRMLCKDSLTAEFKIGIRKLRDACGILEKITENYYQYNIKSSVEELSIICSEQKIISVSSFLGLSKEIINVEGDKYSPSSGEKSILLLQHILESDADAYLLDEPELGMGNSYIDMHIRPKLSELGKQGKTVVVATHNANIAVRTLPYMSILRVHENGCYKTYVGNPFNDELVNIENSNEKKNWVEESMHTLEGGKEAFYERRNVYESGNN